MRVICCAGNQEAKPDLWNSPCLLYNPLQYKKEIVKIKETENKKELSKVEEEAVSGGIIPLINQGEPVSYPHEKDDKEDRSGGATGSW